MGKFGLLLLAAIGAAFYFPSSRLVVYEKAAPVLDPVLRWSANREMKKIVHDLERYDEIYARLPDQREWSPWLEDNFAGDAGTDPWSNKYIFRSWTDSFYVASPGPDRIEFSQDDFRIFSFRN